MSYVLETASGAQVTLGDLTNHSRCSKLYTNYSRTSARIHADTDHDRHLIANSLLQSSELPLRLSNAFENKSLCCVSKEAHQMRCHPTVLPKQLPRSVKDGTDQALVLASEATVTAYSAIMSSDTASTQHAWHMYGLALRAHHSLLQSAPSKSNFKLVNPQGNLLFSDVFAALTTAYFSSAHILLATITSDTVDFADLTSHSQVILNAATHIDTHHNAIAYTRMATPLLVVVLHAQCHRQRKQAIDISKFYSRGSMKGISALSLNAVRRKKAE
ncbi:uncharacterized protein EKO05_0001141 [Ascochyta rabiei]|uniref:uncharacterized protein n=1 Tax=Didymella rabiei TaxID=5454 RepID=UPI00220389AF|nr:uncharacterized protein EKO05_0001141 [Ascochyta rabiei]UPX10483.1 hypothetical protein EKO05_0001141 [Ascochyta rabiei]